MKVLFYSILRYTRNFSLLLYFSCQLLLADWPRHRGDAALTGRSESKLGNKLDLLWTYETGEFLKSSVVVEKSFAYVGSDDGKLHAIDLSTGKCKWTFKTEMAVEAPPLLHKGQVIVGSTDGFGILAAASICPIVAVLTLGIYVQFKVKREERRVARELALEGETK